MEETSITNTHLFLSEDNQKALINSLYSLHLKHGFDMPISYFYQKIPEKMKAWVKTHDLNSFECLGSGINYYIEALQYINRLFIREYTKEAILETSLHNEIPDTALTNDIQISTVNEDKYSIKRKDLKDVLTSDYNNIDVWTSLDVSARNGQYRRNNRLNVDQISRHSRPYDRENATEGLRATINNSSYTNHHQRGFGQIYQDYINNMTQDEDRHLYL